MQTDLAAQLLRPRGTLGAHLGAAAPRARLEASNRVWTLSFDAQHQLWSVVAVDRVQSLAVNTLWVQSPSHARDASACVPTKSVVHTGSRNLSLKLKFLGRNDLKIVN
jgi:hypothetical protein